MIVIAKTIVGKEYYHSTREMYEVPKGSASKICEIMNNVHYRLKDSEAWHVYDEYLYEPAGRLSVRKGVVKLKTCSY